MFKVSVAILKHVFKATLCNFDSDPLHQKSKFKDARQHVAQNSNFIETGSYYLEKMSSGFPSDVLRLICLNSVINEGS